VDRRCTTGFSGIGGSATGGEADEAAGADKMVAVSPEAEALSASLEDYLEAILLLERTSRVARVSEIAGQLGVSRPSVTGALKSLTARRLVAHAPYGHVTLTDEGARIALEVERRHLAIRDFLTEVLGIPADRAETTACKLEHVLEADTLAYFVSYAEGRRA
jgi:DtxR family Mn-dependent transcriptional regulator